MPPRLLVCQRAPVHAKHGYAGRSIEHFPPFGFYKLYQQNPGRAEEAFTDWYRRRFIQGAEWKIDKPEGGMGNGSLHRLVLQMHEAEGKLPGGGPEPYDPKVVEEAIARRVRHYLDVFESIRAHGYLESKGHVRCVETIYGDLEIVAGHHRVAAAHALGIPELTVQVVSPDPRSVSGRPREPVEGSPASWDDEQIRHWIASSDWYQRIPVRDGLVTPGTTDSVERLKKLALPSLDGKTVLDIGCNSGMYSFECERLGASRVVGIDLNQKRLRQALTLKEILGSRVEFREMSLYEAPSLGRFDYVLCIAVLHETSDLLGALAILKEAAKLAIYLEISLWKPPLSRRVPVARLVGNKRARTLLPTRALVEKIMGDSFEIEYRGPSVRYDLFRAVRKSSIDS